MWRLFRNKCAVPGSLRFSSGESPIIEPHIEMVERVEDLPKYCQVVLLQMKEAIGEATTIVAKRTSCSNMLQETSTKQPDTFQRRLGVPGRKPENAKKKLSFLTRDHKWQRTIGHAHRNAFHFGECGSMITKTSQFSLRGNGSLGTRSSQAVTHEFRRWHRDCSNHIQVMYHNPPSIANEERMTIRELISAQTNGNHVDILKHPAL